MWFLFEIIRFSNNLLYGYSIGIIGFGVCFVLFCLVYVSQVGYVWFYYWEEEREEEQRGRVWIGGEDGEVEGGQGRRELVFVSGGGQVSCKQLIFQLDGGVGVGEDLEFVRGRGFFVRRLGEFFVEGGVDYGYMDRQDFFKLGIEFQIMGLVQVKSSRQDCVGDVVGWKVWEGV